MENLTIKVVEGDLERVYERAEEFETKIRDLETQFREMESKVLLRNFRIINFYSTLLLR